MIVFTTAFLDIGRKNWGILSRDTEKYISHFNNMINDGFEYPLIVYSHQHVIKEMIGSRSYPSNIMFVDISGVDTFLKEPYISNETAIINDPVFQTKIPDFRKGAIEHTYPKYTLLTHSKICIVRHTKNLLPNFAYYAWIDFGYPLKTNICGWPPCPYPAVPKNINFSLLERKFHIASFRVFCDRVDEYLFLKHNCSAFYAFSFIVHSMVLETIYEMYVAKLDYWQKNLIADDEQNLLYQLFQDRPELFKIFRMGSSPWGLYRENLNSDAVNPVVLHPRGDLVILNTVNKFNTKMEKN